MIRMTPFAALALMAACGNKAATPTTAATKDAAPLTDAAPPPDAAAIDAGVVDAGGPDAPVTPAAVTAEVKRALEASMRAAGVTEACLVIRAPTGMMMVSDEAVCAEPLTPASTFKLPNALIGADAGFLESRDTVMPYDAAAYPKQAHWPKEWSRDQPLWKALEVSAVPLFQGLATRIGAPRMQEKLDAFGYGNRSTAGGIDRFWLSGGLRISALEQIAFLTGLTSGTLPVSAKAHEVVRDATPSEQAETRMGATTLKWKTGTSVSDTEPAVGWLVGWLVRPSDVCQFACWIKRAPGSDLEKFRAERIAVCRGALDRLGLFPAPKP